MNQALKDLEGYTGDDTAEFFYSYNNDLAEIYYALANADGSETNYKLALNYYQEVIDQIQGKVTVSETNASDSVQSYIQAYINNMCRMADIYGKLGDSDSALETYEKAESELGEGNTNAVKVYSEHLNYLYTTYESAQQDPGKWTAAQKEKILKVYNEGNKLDGIGSNPNWIKRSSVMEGLGDGSIEEEEKEEEKTDEETTEEDTEEEGE